MLKNLVLEWIKNFTEPKKKCIIFVWLNLEMVMVNIGI